MVIGGSELRRCMAVALLGLPARAGGVEATFAKGPIAERRPLRQRARAPTCCYPATVHRCCALPAPAFFLLSPVLDPRSPPFGGWPYASDSVMEDARSIRQRTEAVTANTGRDVMRLTFKLHATSPPFVELCLETWRQDVHGGTPIISPHLTTAGEIKKSCANFRAQIDRVEREAIAALHGIKKKS
jgi:hypothetical protein